MCIGAAAGAFVSARVALTAAHDSSPSESVISPDGCGSRDESDSEGDSEDDEGCETAGSSDEDTDEDDVEMKMVLIVRKDLKMGKGKCGAQCGHATLGAYRIASRSADTRKWIKAWQRYGQKKVCLAVTSEAELNAVAELFDAKGIPTYIVVSAVRREAVARPSRFISHALSSNTTLLRCALDACVVRTIAHVSLARAPFTRSYGSQASQSARHGESLVAG